MSRDHNIVPGTPQKAALTPLARAKQLTQALLATAVVIFVVGGGGIYLIVTKIQATQKLAVDRASLAGNSQAVASRYQATMDTYTQDQGQLHFLEASVSQQAFVPTLLQQLQALATSTQLSVTSVRPGDISATKPAAGRTSATGPSDTTDQKPAAPLPYTIQPITVSVSGTYPQLMRFIYSLPHFPKILALHSVNLHPDTTPGPGAGGSADAPAAKNAEPKVAADITLDAYVFNADPVPAAAPAPQPGTFSDARQAQADVMSQAAGRAVGTARQDAQTENAIHAQTPIAAPMSSAPVSAVPGTMAPSPTAPAAPQGRL